MRDHCRILLAFCCVWLAAAAVPARSEGETELGPAPVLLDPGAVPLRPVSKATAGLSVDPQNRVAVARFFHTVYTPALAEPIGWTGNVTGCVAGTTSQANRDATMQIVNYFRAMTGLPGNVAHVDSLIGGVQEAALMMIAEGGLSHSPPPTWACYTSTGASAAGTSNLALGRFGPAAIVAYIQDSGGGNVDVGHRRWILYPPQAGMASGSNNGSNGFFFGANALNVFTSFTSRPATPSIVAWPPPGFVPYQVVYPRWSMSLNTVPGANYLNAVVTMSRDGENVPLTVVSRSAGFGDSTIVWEPAGLSFGPAQDGQTFTVTVENIGGSPPVSYDVTIIDPALIPEQVFTDGFESGNVSRWSAAG